MKKFALGIVLACFGILALSDVGHAQTASSAVELELDFDALFEWKKPCTMNAEQLEAKLAALETVAGKKVYTLDSSATFSQHSQLFNPVYNKAYKLKYHVFGSKSFEPESARVMWKDGHIDYIMIRYTAQEGETEAAPELLTSIGDALGASTFSRTDTGYSWMGKHYVASARFTKSHDDSIFFVSVSPKNPVATQVVSGTARSNSSSTPPAVAPSPPPAAAPSDLKINLDELLDWKNPVSISREEFEKKLSALKTPPAASPTFWTVAPPSQRMCSTLSPSVPAD